MLHILYTANIRGDLTLLPRLQTFLRQLKALPLDEGDDVMICAVQPVARRTLLLDLGNTCSPDAWHCAATGGRSVLIGLDAMGYQAANVEGTLTADGRAKLRDNLMSMALVDAGNPWQDAEVVITADEQSPATSITCLQIVLKPGSSTQLDGQRLHLAAVEAGQVGVVHVGGSSTFPILQAHSIFDLAKDTPSDATIAGTVDFITNEARFYQKRHASP